MPESDESNRLPAADEDSLMISPHNVAIVGQIERELRKGGYHLMLRGISQPAEVAEALQSWSLDGAVLLGFLDEELDRLSPQAVGKVSLLAIDSYSANPLTTGVRSDDYTGALLAARHLLELGHREIVFAGPSFSDVGVVHQRFEGFQAAYAEAGLTWTERLVNVATTTHATGRELGRTLMTEHPDATAVFATADILAIGIMEGLTDSGYSVPGDISVLGFDDLDLSEYVTPKLTTIAQDIPRKAAIAVRLLLAAIERKEHPADPITLDVRLVTRDSTAPITSRPSGPAPRTTGSRRTTRR